MSGKPAIPTTTKGYKIFPRTYILWTRANKIQLLQKLRKWVDDLNETSEYLAEWTPSTQVQKLEIPNNYYVILENVSSKEIRNSFLQLLIHLRKQNIIMPREGRIVQSP